MKPRPIRRPETACRSAASGLGVTCPGQIGPVTSDYAREPVTGIEPPFTSCGRLEQRHAGQTTYPQVRRPVSCPQVTPFCRPCHVLMARRWHGERQHCHGQRLTRVKEAAMPACGRAGEGSTPSRNEAVGCLELMAEPRFHRRARTTTPRSSPPCGPSRTKVRRLSDGTLGSRGSRHAGQPCRAGEPGTLANPRRAGELRTLPMSRPTIAYPGNSESSLNRDRPTAPAGEITECVRRWPA